MISIKRIAALAASGALAASIIVAAPASAINYAPGLPPAAPGVPNNPPAAAPIVPTVTLVDQATAEQATTRQMTKAPSERLRGAPRVRAKAGDPIALSANGLTPGATYVISVKRRGGEYGTLGSVVGTAGGTGTMPVFEASRAGVYVLALTNVATGEVQYIKVRVRR